MLSHAAKRTFDLSLLRASLKSSGIHAFYLPHSDPHQSEYLPDYHSRVRHISGFTGSSAQVVLTHTEAILWTDSRYWIQAQNQLQNEWKLMKSGETGVKKYQEWLLESIPKGGFVGFDPTLVSADEVEKRTTELSAGNITFKAIQPNPIDSVWVNRPQLPVSRIFPMASEHTGTSTREKALQICKKLQEKKQKFVLTSELTEIAWLLNIRGGDIPYNPVFYAYLLLECVDDTQYRIELYTDRLSGYEHLIPDSNCTIYPYDHIYPRLQQIQTGVICDKSQTNYSLWQALHAPISVPSFISSLKTIKNATEIAGFQNAHKRDAVAFIQFWSWLRDTLPTRPVTELEAAQVMNSFRRNQPLFHDLSFPTISASHSNAAIVHHTPTDTSISTTAPYLIDSGAHYLDGTTDVTRTIHFGTPTEEHKTAYTKVLLGNIDLERTIWPEDSRVSGADLDVIARRRLWESGLDYKHGTGHGVGHCLSVHEGPPRISKLGTTILHPGMILSNEPGYYLQNSFGIRIENLMLVRKTEKMKGFLGFKTLTLIPYDRNLIDVRLLTKEDVQHIDQFHAGIAKCLKEAFGGNSKESRLIEWATAPLR